ncbi:hypothetical protein F5879DRAFT_976552 [Lentinula edodes]|nr:hypothetical protein F5879DRAFT_976552 [Lentinula edodes]
MVLDVTPRGGNKTTFIHIYNDPSMGRQQILWRLQHLDLALQKPTVITGDANLHHIRWSRGAPRSSSITDEVVAWFPHDTGKHPSVSDLTWANVHATRIDATRDWAIEEKLAVGSDHIGLRWVLNSNPDEIDNPMGIRYNMKEVKSKDWIKAFDNEVETP